MFPNVSFPPPKGQDFACKLLVLLKAHRPCHPRRSCLPLQMGKLRCILPVIRSYAPFFDIVPQLNYVALADSEKGFTTFASTCAQTGAAKYLPASMIRGNATGSDIRLLFTSTIDVSSATSARVFYEEIYSGSIARFEATEGRIHRVPGTSEELGCKSYTYYLRLPSEETDTLPVHSQHHFSMLSNTLRSGQQSRTSSSTPSSSRS